MRKEVIEESKYMNLVSTFLELTGVNCLKKTRIQMKKYAFR